MMKKLKFILLLIASTLLIISCDTESEEIKSEEINIVNNSNIKGKIFDIEKEPISGVIIEKEGKEIGKSKEDGNFYLSEELIEGDVVTFSNPNYVTVTKVFNKYSQLNISMKPRTGSIVIDSNQPNIINVGSNGTIEIPENVFSHNREPYYGEVEIRATYIDVTNSSNLRSAPGSYIAEGEDGLYPLTSYGMIEFVASIPENGERLELLEDRSLTVSFPILDEQVPDRVNLYNLNTRTGYWSQTGVLYRTDDLTLRGEITDIDSAWNADEPCSDSLVCVKVRVVNPDGSSTFCGIGAEGISYNGFDGLNATDPATDYVELMVCPNSVFELQACYLVCTGCPGPLYTKTIDLSTITMNPSGCTDLGTWILL